MTDRVTRGRTKIFGGLLGGWAALVLVLLSFGVPGEQYLQFLDDYGDSALWTATAGMAAAFRYAATGAEPDRDRLERFARASVSQFDVTGIDGYLARFHFEAVPAGTRIKNGRAMAE